MKIQKVKITDFKVIKNLEKEINGNNILLLGENGVGKSTFIQFIEIALGKQTDIPVNAEGEGLIVADKDGKEFTFKVKFKNGKPVVEVISPDGFKDNRKSTIASLVGAVDFDIDEFVGMSSSESGRKKQVQIYKSFLPKETQAIISDQEYRVKKSYDERTEKNREAKLLEGYIAEHPFKSIVETIPDQPVETEKLQLKIDEALKNNKKITEAAARQEQRKKEIDDKRNEIDRILESIKELEKTGKEAEKWLKENTVVEIDELITQKENATKINGFIDTKADYDKKMTQLDLLKNEAGELTAFIESSRQVIEDAIKDCTVPVDGLTFDSENLIYNGVPVSEGNLSSSEIMHLGCKLKMAENPELGVLFIQRGESLGTARLREIQEMAKKHNWQIIMEQVERGNDKLTIEIMN